MNTGSIFSCENHGTRRASGTAKGRNDKSRWRNRHGRSAPQASQDESGPASGG
jgi:hypothetical protein